MNRALFLVFACLVVLCTAWESERLIAYSDWTLLENSHWISSKLFMVPLMGAFDYVAEREALAGGRLNLSAWHGYQEVTYEDPYAANHFSTQFDLEKGAYLWIFFDQSPSRRVGVLVSRSPLFRTGLYEVSLEGGFLASKPLSLPVKGRNRLSLIKTSEDSAQLMLNGEAKKISWSGPGESLLSFRGGKKKALVREINILKSDGKSQKVDFVPPFKPILFFGILTGLSLIWLLPLKPKTSLILSVSLLALVAYVWAIDYFYWSRIYPYDRLVPDGEVVEEASLLRLEHWRRELFGVGQRKLPPSTKRLQPYITPGSPAPLVGSGISLISPGSSVWHVFSDRWRDLFEHPLPGPIIAFVGTSQLFGSGGTSLNASGAAHLVRLLNAAQNHKVYGLNLSEPGANLSILLLRYEAILEKVSPRVVVVNLGLNDSARPLFEFSRELDQLISLSRAHHTQIVISLEPSSPEEKKWPNPILEHLRRVALAEGLALVDSKAYFEKPSVIQKGILFWDKVHMTSFGQHLWAENIFQKLDWKALLKNRK